MTTLTSTYLEEVFNSFWVVAVTFSANTLDFLDLTGFACCLNVLEVNLRVLGEIYDRSEEVKQSCNKENIFACNMSHKLHDKQMCFFSSHLTFIVPLCITFKALERLEQFDERLG